MYKKYSIISPYNLTFEQKPGYLFASVTGDIDSMEISQRYWTEIAAEIEKSQPKKLMVWESFNTNISTAQYTVTIVGSSFDAGSNGLVVSTASPNPGDFNPLNVYAFQSGGTWRLAADYKNSGVAGGSNGNWTIYCLIINNTVVKSLSTITTNLGGLSNGSASAPSGL